MLRLLFGTWGVVRTHDGHTFAGRVRQARPFGVPMVRVDIPIAGDFTRHYVCSTMVESFTGMSRRAVLDGAGALADRVPRIYDPGGDDASPVWPPRVEPAF